MFHNMRFILLFIFVVFATSCSMFTAQDKLQIIAKNLPSCYIVFDAGSSGTRLYIYEKLGENLQEYPGPKVTALADPIREIRGKKIKDIEAVATEVVSALDDIKHDGPQDKNGNPKWKAFNWATQCHVVSAVVYGTAGMRIAEQQNPDESIELWINLTQKLKAKVGDSVDVITHTITGYEEGIYTWLAIREQKKNNNFGIVGMGGASSQVTFPCSKCDKADDALIPVTLKGSRLNMYSYSFLGLGQDEAPKVLGIPKTCTYGIGTTQSHWKVNDCAKQIMLSNNQGIRDPYNFKASHQGTYRQIPTDRADVTAWVLTEAFMHMNDKQIDQCCVNKGQCFNETSSCFRAVYLDKYLQSLNIPITSEKMEGNWTLGAVVCAEENCLQKAPEPVCSWLADGCL